MVLVRAIMEHAYYLTEKPSVSLKRKCRSGPGWGVSISIVCRGKQCLQVHGWRKPPSSSLFTVTLHPSFFLLVFLVPQLPEVVDLKYIPISRIMHLNKPIPILACLLHCSFNAVKCRNLVQESFDKLYTSIKVIWSEGSLFPQNILLSAQPQDYKIRGVLREFPGKARLLLQNLQTGPQVRHSGSGRVGMLPTESQMFSAYLWSCNRHLLLTFAADLSFDLPSG